MSVKLDHLNIDLDGDGIPERYELGGGGNANEREISWEDYKNLSEEEQNNGTTYYIPDASGGGSSSGGASVKFIDFKEYGTLKFGVDGDGNYGYYKGDDTFVPFKSGETNAELIWTNPNPELNFDAKIIDLDLSNYSKIIIESQFASDGYRDHIYNTPIEMNRSIIDVNGNTATIFAASTHYYNTGRRATPTLNSIEFSNGFVNGNPSAPMFCVPINIYGIV